MTSVEKRRSGRRSGGHRKHSDGGYSDTSSGGSYLDETDREVSNLTDRAFRSLCIGDEAVYNDSDLCSSSPCTQRDRQLAFSQSGQDRDGEAKEREEHKRAGHERLRIQQCGRDWIHGGIYEAEIQRDPQWEVYGEKTQGRVSATFQHSFVETSQQEESLREEQSSSLSNGTTELSMQQRRSRSRVSSLIRAFNSEGQRDGAGMDGKLREWNDETSWDKSALMSIQQELSEFSTPYQQNFTSGNFPSAGPFSSPDTNLYSSEVAGVAHMNSASSFMRSSHSKHSMSEQFNGTSNFFIHSEFSPFKVWRNHNRFPFQQAEVSGFMHCSEFPKWYETPMYRELSLDAQQQGPYRFDERGVRHPRNTLAPVVPPTLPRATSTSTILQKASAVEKRCESELTGHYPNRTWMQSLGTKGFPLQRPSTASPTSEMSRRVQDTISSVKALQQKIKMMTEQNIATGITANQQGVLCSDTNLNPFSDNAKMVASNGVSSNTSPTPFNISHLLTPLVYAQQEEEETAAISPPLEHPPVRAESRGATPDVRMSSYKSRATSLLFNLKDNRKRVKSTYSPTKFKGLETLEKNKQYSTQEPRDTVIDIPDFPDPDSQLLQVEESSRTNAASNPYANLYNSPGLLTTPNSQPAHTGLYSEYTPSDYQRAQMPSESVHHSGFTGFISENYASYQPANAQNLHEDVLSFTPYKQGMVNNVETLGGGQSRFKPSYTATEIPRLDADNNQLREYFLSKANAEQHFNATVGRDFTQVDRYQQLKENKHDYSNVSLQDSWRQTNSQGTENLSLKAISPWKQEITALMEKDQHAQAYQRTGAIKEEANSLSNTYRGENQQSVNKELEKIEFRESFGIGKNELVNTNISNPLSQNAPFSNDTIEKTTYYGQQQSGTLNNKYILQKYNGNTKEDEMKDNYLTQRYNKYTDQEYRNQHILYSNKDKSMLSQETGQRTQYTPIPKVYEMQSLQPIETKPQLEHNMQNKSLSNPDNASAPTMANKVKDRQFVEVRTEQAVTEHTKAQHAQAELAKAQHWAQVEQPKAESSRLILAGQTGSVKVKADQAKAELKEHERVHQGEAKHIEEEKRKKERTEQSREKQPERAREEQKETDQTSVHKVTEELRHIKEEVGAEHLREYQGEQVKVKRAEAERLKEEHMKAELAKTEQAAQARLEEVKLEQIQEQQAKAKQEKIKIVEAEKVKANNILVEDVKQEKAEEELQVSQLNAHQPTTQISQAKERKAEQAKLEQTKAELTKTKIMQEKLAEPAAKLTVTHQIKSEPDPVEQVKTDLAKIKEKMRGEQVRHTVYKKEDGIQTDLPLKLNIHTNEENKDQDQANQMHQQREDIVVISGQYSDQANRVSDEYEYLREKYGFIDTTSANRIKVSAAANVSSNDANETPAESLDKVETTNNERSKDNPSPTSKVETANTEHKEEGECVKPPELTESHYVYSESSKEFKLSGENNVPNNVDSRANMDIVRDKVKDDSVEKLEKGDPLKHTDISHHRDSDSAKLPLPDRNLKSTEHGAGPGKDQHFTPPRALSSKERAQAKQEMLTSKIKAHAEKEISAIKEKGFAVRDGFISKNSTKQLAGSQSNNIRQRPPSQEVPKKHESTMPSNMTPKHQMEPSGIQIETVKSVLPPSSATIPVRSAATTSPLVDQLLKQVPKEPMKSNDNVPKPLGEEQTMGSYPLSTDEGLVENRMKENPSEIKSTIQSKEQAPKNKEGKQEANQGEISGKQKEGLKDNPAVNNDHFNKKKEDPSQATALVKAENSERMATEKAESKHEAVHEDSAPSLHLVLGQNKTPVDDDILQITGIMVTVRERKLSTDNGQRKNSTQGQIKVKECSNSERDECHPGSRLEVSKGNTYSKEVSTVQKTHPTVKKDPTRVDMNNHLENVQENPTIETRQNNVSENVTVKRTNHQLESSSINTRPQLHEQFAEKHVPSSVAVPTKNKDFAETQPLLYKQDIIASETKDCSNETSKENSAKSIGKDTLKSNTEENNLQKRQTAHTNDNFMAKVVNTTISSTKTNRADAETLIKHDVQPSVKEDMTTVINPSESKNIDGKNTPQVQEKGCDSTTPKPFNKTSPSNHLTENENTQVFPKHQDKETHIGGNNQKDDTVHIGSIAVRVVPSVTEKDNLKVVGKHHVPLVPCDVVTADEQKQVASSGLEENVNSLNNEDRTKDLTSASSENQIKHGLEDTSGVQCVLSSVKKLSNSQKICNQPNNRNANSEITQAENAMPENVNKNRKSVDESKIRPMVGDYFQVQGEAERNNEPHNCTNVGDMSKVVSKEKELPGLPPNKAAISNELCSEGNNEDFMLDQSKSKTVESSSVRKNRETDGNLASKQSYCPTERHSNKNEKTEAGQASHIRKHHTENQSSLSARERQSSRNSNATKDNIGKEKPEVKPIPKERVSTIPEISALADYARLKVIVSEDEANAIQEFPPNKKEGFFPLIQSRHSRRPVFTVDPQDVKDKRLPNKTEVSPKVNKEPKPLVFPITEKEHQRTGMFKLADKERQEKMPLDAKANEGVVDTRAKQSQHLKERNTPQTTPLKNQGSEEQVSGTDAQRVHQVEQSIHQPNKPPFQAATLSSAVNRARSTSVSQHLKPLDNATPHEKPVGQVYNIEGCTATLRKDERTKNAPVKVEEERTEKIRQERLATQHEETKAQQQRIAKQFEERQSSKIEEEKRAEEIRVKHLMEENRASLAEEERRAAQREEERRARERETIAMKIKERREKQREAERKTEEIQAAQKEEKEIEEKRIIKIEEGRRGKLREEEERIKENEERRRVKRQQGEKAAQEEQRRRAGQEEQQRRAGQEEQQRRDNQEEQQRRDNQKMQQRRAAKEEQQRRADQEEQQRRADQEEQQRRADQEEQQRRADQEEQQRRADQEEQQRRADQEEQQRADQEEKQRRAAQEERQMRAAPIEEKRQAKQIEEKILTDIEEEKKRKQSEEGKEEKAAHISEEERFKQEQKIEEQRVERRKKEKGMRTQTEKDESIAVEPEKTIIKQREENQTKEQRNRCLEQSQAALKEEEKRVTHEWMLAQREDEIRAKKREGEKEKEEKLANHIEKERDTRVGEQKKAAQRMDALQYYAITSTDTERKPRERPLSSPLPSQQRHNPPGLGSSEDPGSHTRPYRSHAPASPAPSLPRSNTSSPALGGKPLMFRVKDNTMRGSSFKSVKPRFHKNFGEDFRVGSPMERGSEREEDEQEIMRRSAGTPVYPDTGLNRLAAIKESSTFQSAYLSQNYSALLPQYKPYSRRSFALEEDDSRSVISNMSEGGESFATSAADLADIRGLYDYERPESACSFSSDVSRSLGKPPTVPPKSEKALRRAQRLTTRRIKKELSKIVPNSHAGVEKSLQDTSGIPSSIEMRSSSRQTVASPHFSSPVSLAHAPTLGSSFPSSQSEHQSSHSSFYASPHATGPTSLPVASPHATDPASLPDASPKVTGPASQTAAPRTVAHVPSSPTLLHANHQAPVTQYHVESSYPHSYPLTQRKVLQDLGSGQYFVVDVPVQVKTKTFFDPETGKYVQLNVRQSGQSTALPQPQQTYSQPQLQPQMQVKLQQQPQASPAGKPFVLYQGNHSYPQDYEPQTITSVPCLRSSAPLTLHQEQQPVGESYGYPAHEMEQKSEGHRYSPEKTPYMDTVNDKDKTYSTVYNTHGPNEWFPESDTNSQLAGSSVCENDNSAHSQCQPRDIITMSELDDFMEMSDW